MFIHYCQVEALLLYSLNTQSAFPRMLESISGHKLSMLTANLVTLGCEMNEETEQKMTRHRLEGNPKCRGNILKHIAAGKYKLSVSTQSHQFSLCQTYRQRCREDKGTKMKVCIKKAKIRSLIII